MRQLQVFDAPIIDPDDDLFEMVDYAEKLAGFIENVNPPFTIGIYGEWGEGKTSFVGLLRRFLESAYPSNIAQSDGQSTATNQIKFITFSAWPHTTSDALWRALIIKIAKDLYNVAESESTTGTETISEDGIRDSGFWPKLTKFLSSDAVIFYKPPPAPDPLAEYRETISRLDQTMYGSISKNTEQQREINQEMAFMSIVKAAMAALGTVSPLVAGIRSLFGLESNINLSDLYVEKNVATRTMIESMQDFKNSFRTLFEEKAKEYKRVFIFVDDLDRCLPDVALDLLEAVKVFFDEVDFIFIVAADENLIGQGLRLRYKELFTGRDNTQGQAFFDQKGQEYFEKIIQFAVRVPPRTTEQSHTFIAAQFPKWTPTTDIIQTAIGSNPRRIKQYCNLLSYQYMVFDLQKKKGLNKGN
jgi:predicted KAP-like P-loop ATPase